MKRITSAMLCGIDAAGTVTTIAGSGVAADVDGIGLQASFDGPQGLTIDFAGLKLNIPCIKSVQF